MKIFYTKRCCWICNKNEFKSYNDAQLYEFGYNDAFHDDDDDNEINIVQRENVKIFAYEYDFNNEMLKVAQVVWRYEGEPQYNTYWTRDLRKKHLQTVKTRLIKRPFEIPLSKDDWEQAMYTSREKLIEKTFYRYHFELNKQIKESFHNDEISEYGDGECCTHE